jgi:hypothetical protein
MRRGAAPRGGGGGPTLVGIAPPTSGRIPDIHRGPCSAPRAVHESTLHSAMAFPGEGKTSPVL